MFKSQAQKMVVCKGCRQKRPHHAKGYCHPCYKREEWRPNAEASKRRRDYESSNMNKTGVRPGDHPRGARQCGVCKRFKSRPSSICDHCGNDPVSYNGDRFAYDQAMGYDN